MSNKKVHLTILIEPELKRDLKIAALKKDSTVTEVLTNLIIEYLDQE